MYFIESLVLMGIICGTPIAMLTVVIWAIVYLTRKPKAVPPPVPIQTIQKDEEKMDDKFKPMWVPEDKTMGWQFEINGELVEGIRFLKATNPRVGEVFFAWNGRFGQPLIRQNPGRMVYYVTKHPSLGWLFGGAEEPRLQCNGKMFTAAGGYDPAAGSELKAIQAMPEGPDKTAALEKYGKVQVAREILEEMGLDVTNVEEVGLGVSNRSIYMADLTCQDATFNGEHYNVCEIPFESVTEEDGHFFIRLPEDKMGDVQPAPEWSAISKLEFVSFEDYTDSLDTVAVGGAAKVRTWLIRKYGQ